MMTRGLVRKILKIDVAFVLLMLLMLQACNANGSVATGTLGTYGGGFFN